MLSASTDFNGHRFHTIIRSLWYFLASHEREKALLLVPHIDPFQTSGLKPGHLWRFVYWGGCFKIWKTKMFSYCNYLSFSDTHKPAQIHSKISTNLPRAFREYIQNFKFATKPGMCFCSFQFQAPSFTAALFPVLINTFSSSKAAFESMKDFEKCLLCEIGIPMINFSCCPFSVFMRFWFSNDNLLESLHIWF